MDALQEICGAKNSTMRAALMNVVQLEEGKGFSCVIDRFKIIDEDDVTQQRDNFESEAVAWKKAIGGELKVPQTVKRTLQASPRNLDGWTTPKRLRYED